MSASLILAVKNGDRLAFEQLLESYAPLIESECVSVLSKFPDFSGEAEEIKQESRLALYDAAMSYKEGEVTFGLYAKICIHNRLISYLRKLRTARKRQAKIASRPQANTGREQGMRGVFYSDDTDSLQKLFDKLTSPYEKKAFLMYLDNMSYGDIATTLGKSVKSVANAIARAKAKIKAHFKAKK